MKTFVVFSLIVLSAAFVSSAQPRRGDKNSKLAVLLAYKPNSEIKTKDKTNNKTWTYEIDESASDETKNDELLTKLITERFATRLMPHEIKDNKPLRRSVKTVKRENNNHDDFDSHQSHEDSVEADPAEIVEVSKENEKKICYKNTYKNVLNAFESALKNQIENYKKCVCQKKKDVTTTTAATTTTTSTTEAAPKFRLKSKDPGTEENDADDNDQVISSALEDKNNIVCFHKQHAFHLTKLLDLIPCQSTDEPRPEIEEVNEESVKRAERNNVRKYQESDEDSIEIDVAQIASKPKTTTSKPVRKLSKSADSNDDKDKLNQQILALVKDHLSSRKSRKTADEKVHNKQTSPKKIIIKAKAITNDEESEDENASEESVEEFGEQELMRHLQELFLKYKIGSDETFPMQSDEHSAKSASSMSLQKFASKSSTLKNEVSESSDESTEKSIKLKSRKFEKMRHQLEETSRKSSSNRDGVASNRSDNIQRKSYRSSSRTKANEDAAHPVEAKNVSRTANDKKLKKSPRTSTNDRSSSEIAKKVSTFARGKSSSRKNE